MGLRPAGPHREYRRALGVFIAVFVLAAAAVVWVAVREVGRERLVRENERTTELKRAADGIADRLQAKLKNEFAPLAEFSTAMGPAKTRDELASAVTRRITVPGVFREVLLAEAGRAADVLSFRPPFREASGAGVRTEPASDVAARDLLQGEKLEFQAKDYPGALAAYEKAVSNSRIAPDRARALNALARSFRKSGQTERSMEIYARIRREASDVLSSDGLPLGLLAAIEIGNIQKESARSSAAAETWLGLYAEILDGRYPLDRGQFLAYLALLDGLIGPGPGPAGRSADLRKRAGEIEERSRIGDLIRLHFSVPPAGQAGLANEKAAPSFQTRTIDGANWIAGYFRLSEGNFLGAVIDETTLIQAIILPSLSADRAEPGIAASVVDGSGRTIGGAKIEAVASAPSFQEALPAPVSMWTVRLVDRRPIGAEPEFRRRRNLYFGAAILVLAALFAGGWTTLRGMAKDIEVADLKSDFVATVSHELRTPVTGIRALSELLKNGRVADDPTRRRYYDTLFRESDRLGRMIENILDFSKMEAGLKEYRFAPVDPAALTRAVADRFGSGVADKGFHLSVEIGRELPLINLDEDAVARALFNLLDNAAKYSGEAREIGLSVRRESETVAWEVRDRGVGIPMTDLPRVFDKFYRSKKASDLSVRGSGIGLTLVKHIVEAHGGRASLISIEGEGTTARIEIPIEGEHGQAGE
jgi:signal transduction histidine kinase